MRGIKPADIGSNKVTIEPYFGDLTKAKVSMPQPKRKISLAYKLANGKHFATLSLLREMTGTLPILMCIIITILCDIILKKTWWNKLPEN